MFIHGIVPTFQHVWSDNDDLLEHLAPTQDALSSCKERSLTEVLNMAHRDFTLVSCVRQMKTMDILQFILYSFYFFNAG